MVCSSRKLQKKTTRQGLSAGRLLAAGVTIFSGYTVVLLFCPTPTNKT